MGFRVRRSIKLAPGLRLNLSKSGLGLSAGVRGARVSVNSHGRVTNTVGIPGSGLSYSTSHRIGTGSSSHPQSAPAPAMQRAVEVSSNPDVKLKGEFLIFIGGLVMFSALGVTQPSDAIGPLAIGGFIALIGYIRMTPWLKHRREVKYRALPKVQYQDSLSVWQSKVDALAAVRTAFTHALDGTTPDTTPVGVILKKNEVCLTQEHGFLRRAQDESPSDEGMLSLTTERLIFTGQAKAVEWALSKLTAAVPDDAAAELGLWVSNRSTVHYVSLAAGDWPGFIFAFNWTLDFQRERDKPAALWAHFDHALAELESQKPLAPKSA